MQYRVLENSLFSKTSFEFYARERAGAKRRFSESYGVLCFTSVMVAANIDQQLRDERVQLPVICIYEYTVGSFCLLTEDIYSSEVLCCKFCACVSSVMQCCCSECWATDSSLHSKSYH